MAFFESSSITSRCIKKYYMGCVAETASFSSLVWWPCACLRMRSIVVSLKVDEKQVSY